VTLIRLVLGLEAFVYFRRRAKTAAEQSGTTSKHERDGHFEDRPARLRRERASPPPVLPKSAVFGA